MNYLKRITICVFLIVAIFFSCESQSSEIRMENLDRIANSDEFHAYRSAVHQLFLFSSTHPVDQDAVIKRMKEYPDRSMTKEFPAELLKGIPNAVEEQQLNIIRFEAMQVIKRKFSFIDYSPEDRAKIHERYDDLHKTYYELHELEEILATFLNEK